MTDDREHPIQDDAHLADELEQAMSDPTEWGEPIHESRPRRSEKRQRAAMISIRLTAEELDAVQEAAAARGLSVSRYVRECALRPVRSRAANPVGLLVVTNRTSMDRTTSADMPTPPIAVPTVTAASPPFLLTSESAVSSAAAP